MAKVSHPLEEDGLGFNFKWNMGWMNDILEYMEVDPIYRKDYHSALTFSMMYAFSERFILPLSHDEVVHGKRSLLDKMPGNYNDKFSNLRLLYQYMFAHPGKKLLFMGGEFGQFVEWRDYTSLDWHLLEYEMHSKLHKFTRDLNLFYSNETCLYERDTSYEGFQWIEHHNHMESIIAFERLDNKGERLICVFNFTPVPRPSYPIGVMEEGTYHTLFNSDHQRYGGSTKRNRNYKSTEEKIHDRNLSIRIDIPPLGAVYLKLKKEQMKTGGNKNDRK